MKKEKTTIGKKLVFHFIACGLAVGLIDLSFSLFKEQHRFKTQMKERIQSEATKKMGSLGQSLLEKNQEETKRILESFLSLKDVEHVEIQRELEGGQLKALMVRGKGPSPQASFPSQPQLVSKVKGVT